LAKLYQVKRVAFWGHSVVCRVLVPNSRNTQKKNQQKQCLHRPVASDRRQSGWFVAKKQWSSGKVSWRNATFCIVRHNISNWVFSRETGPSCCRRSLNDGGHDCIIINHWTIAFVQVLYWNVVMDKPELHAGLNFQTRPDPTP